MESLITKRQDLKAIIFILLPNSHCKRMIYEHGCDVMAGFLPWSRHAVWITGPHDAFKLWPVQWIAPWFLESNLEYKWKLARCTKPQFDMRKGLNFFSMKSVSEFDKTRKQCFILSLAPIYFLTSDRVSSFLRLSGSSTSEKAKSLIWAGAACYPHGLHLALCSASSRRHICPRS